MIEIVLTDDEARFVIWVLENMCGIPDEPEREIIDSIIKVINASIELADMERAQFERGTPAGMPLRSPVCLSNGLE